MAKESVWDYPRPPRIEDSAKRIQVVFGGVVIAETIRAKRVLETSHPPVYYIPPDDIRMEHLSSTDRASYCEWKGRAGYYTITVGERLSRDAGWFYPDPTPAFDEIKNHVAFYPSHVDACYVDGEKVEAQPGDFYGGWITVDIAGPFKGGPGTSGW